MKSILASQLLAAIAYGLPIVIAAAAMVRFLYKSSSRRSQEAKAADMAVMAIGLTSACVSASFFIAFNEQKQDFESLRKTVDGLSDFKAVERPSSRAVIRAIDDVVRDHVPEREPDSDPPEFLRLVTAPHQLPGSTGDSDVSWYTFISTAKFRYTCIAAIPRREDVKGEAHLLARRRRVQEYLFRVLTSSMWQDDRISSSSWKPLLMILVYPITSNLESWSVRMSDRTLCGLLAMDGRVGDEVNVPACASMIQFEGGYAGAVNEDLLLIRRISVGIVDAELRKPYHLREPWAIFCSGVPGQGLVPMSISDLARKSEEILNRWRLDNGITAQMPETLVELGEVVDSLKGLRKDTL